MGWSILRLEGLSLLVLHSFPFSDFLFPKNDCTLWDWSVSHNCPAFPVLGKIPQSHVPLLAPSWAVSSETLANVSTPFFFSITVLGYFYINLTQVKAIWEEGTPNENTPPWDQTVGKPVGCFLNQWLPGKAQPFVGGVTPGFIWASHGE